MIISRVGPLSCAKIACVIYAAIGLVVGALISVFALIATAVYGGQRGLAGNAVPPFAAALIGLGAIIVWPIFYGVIGFLFALIGAWLYNVVASKVGGIEIDLS